MQAAPPAQDNNKDLWILAALFATGLIVFHIALALTGQGFMREQHLGTAVEFAKHGIDLFNPITAGYNANQTPTLLEFPIWQAITAIFMKVLGRWNGWGNAVALLFHLSAIWPLLKIGRRMFGERTAWWTVLFYLAQPFTFLIGGMASSDSTAASLVIWFLYLGFSAIESPSWLMCIIAAGTGCLAAILKAPFFMVGGLTLFFWVVYRHRASFVSWGQLGLMGTTSVLVFFLWSRHGSDCYRLAEFPVFDPRMNGIHSQAFQWWFGDLSEKVNLGGWARAAWRTGIGTLGSWGLVILPIAGLCLQRAQLLRFWLAAAFVTVLVFSHVMFVHWHYFIIFQTPVALLCAIAAAKLENELWSAIPLHKYVRVFIVALVLGASLVEGLTTAHWKMYLTGYAAHCGKLIQQCTSPDERLLVWGEGSVPLFHADRQGLSVLDASYIEDPAKLARLKAVGYTAFVLVNPSPAAEAATTLTGSRYFTRGNLRDKQPAITRDWLVLMENNSVLILRIPR